MEQEIYGDLIDSEEKLLFIQEELSQHGEWLCDRFVEAMERKKVYDTGALMDSVDYSSFTDGSDRDPGLRFSFLSYGRAVEIQYNRARKNKKNQWQDEINKKIWGIRNRPTTRRKDTRWYAKNMYGGLNRLVQRIMYGLTEEEMKRLKGILENRKKSI